MLTLDSDNLLTLTDLQDYDGDTISDADVEIVIETLAGDELLTADLAAIDGEAGAYSAILSADDLADLIEGQRYRITLTATAGGAQLVKRWTEFAKYQGA